MTIQDLGSLGEFVAAVATVATLAYLALQISRNTSAIKSASHHAATDSFNSVNIALSQDPTLARIFRAGSGSLKNLTEDERGQFYFLCVAYFRVWETHFYQSRMGTAETMVFGSELDFSISLPGVREWWESAPFFFSPEFRSYIEGRLLKADESTGPSAAV